MGLNLVKHNKSLTKAQYDALSVKDGNTLYFTTDENKIYLGEKCVGQANTVNKVNNKTGDVTLSAADVNAVAKNTAITGATKCKITYDSKGLVTAGANLTADDIPSLNASKINAGTFDAARIPNLDASKITTGTISDNILPTLQPEKIRTDTYNRFVTDDEKSTWNGKQNALSFTGTPSNENKVVTKDTLDAAVAGASNYLGTVTALSGLSTTAKKGDFYRVKTAWTGVHVGDILIAEVNNPKAEISESGYSLLHNEINTDTVTSISLADSPSGVTVTGKAQTGNIGLGNAAGKMVLSTYNEDTNLTIDVNKGLLPTCEVVDGWIGTKILAAIGELNSEKNAAAGKAITGIKITDGKIESITETEVNNYQLPAATKQTLGGIKVGTNITVNSEGEIYVNTGNGLKSTVNSNNEPVIEVALGTGLEIGGNDHEIRLKFGNTINTACEGNDPRLSNARPASDVKAWAKADNKPSYGANEISYTEQGASSSTDVKSELDIILSALTWD